MNQQTHDAFAALGNGTVQAGVGVLHKIGQRLAHARATHPVFAEGKYHAVGEIGGEYHELVQAVEKEADERVKDELLDVIVTCIRMLVLRRRLWNCDFLVLRS